MAKKSEEPGFLTKNFDYSNELQVTTAIHLLEEKLAIKFVEKMKLYNERAFIFHLNRNSRVRSLVLESLPLLAPEGVVAKVEVQRKVVNNPRISPTSTRVFAVCGKSASEIFCFVRNHCTKLLRTPERLAKAKVLVVVEGLFLAREVTKFLNTMGYAIYQTNAPSSAAQCVLHDHLENFPVFLVSSDLFSGQVCGRLDAAFVFKPQEDIDESLALERCIAREKCNIAFNVFPTSEQGLQKLANHHQDFRLLMPIRI